MIVSVTEINAWKRCRWYWLHNSFNGLALERAITLPPFALGTMAHASIQFWQDHPTATLEQVIMDYDVRALQNTQAIIEHYKAHMSGIDPSPMELKANLAAMVMGRAMIINYYNYYSAPQRGGGPLPTGYALIASEQTLTVPIPHTEHCLYNEPPSASGLSRFGSDHCETCNCGLVFCACRGGHVMDVPAVIQACQCCIDTNYLEGTFDGVVQVPDTNTGELKLYVLEHKTFSRHPTDDGLEHNEQFLRYLWLATRSGLIPEGEVGGILYNGLWKREKVPDGRVMDDMFHRALLDRTPAELDRCTTQLEQVSMEMCYAAPPPNLAQRATLDIDTATAMTMASHNGQGQAKPVSWGPVTPVYKTVPPVDGCNGLLQCVFKDVCDADELPAPEGPGPTRYQQLLQGRYVPRLRTPAFATDVPE